MLLLLPLLMACEADKFNNHNPYIDNYSFSVDVNMNLPLYNNLKYAGNGVYVGGAGVRGVWVFFTGSGYNAFDAACPNQPITSCSTMNRNGGTLICACDNASYSLFTGLADGQQYPLKQYRVQVNGDVLRVYN